MIFIHRVNDVHLMVECEIHVARELSTFFEFEVPGAKFMPAFRNRMWDGKIRLFSIKTNKIYAGLLSYLEDFLKKNNLEYVLHEGVTENVKSINVEDVQGFISSLNISSSYIFLPYGDRPIILYSPLLTSKPKK